MEEQKERSHLDAELRFLKEQIIEMMHLVMSQLEKSRNALLQGDQTLADEVIHKERRVNALELAIDKDVENTLALYQPVAVDLRFVMASFKINSDLERLGDHAEGIAKYISHIDRPFSKEQLLELQVAQMYENALAMLTDVFEAYNTEDTAMARSIFKLDKDINQINTNATKTVGRFIVEDPDNATNYVSALSIIRKLERCGDLAKNIAEEIIFYVEAKVLKHKGKRS